MSQAPVVQWKSCRLQIQRKLVCFLPVFFCLPSHGVPSVKLRFLENFTLYLRNSWSLNLRAIESCICGLRPIEHKMRSILRTVHERKLFPSVSRIMLHGTFARVAYYRHKFTWYSSVDASCIHCLEEVHVNKEAHRFFLS
jgi:hypothetical protein